MSQSNICINIDKNLKEQFDSICDKLGLSVTAAMNLLIKTVVKENGMPLELFLDVPNEETIKAMEDVRNGKNLIGPFASAQEAVNSMLEDDDV